VCLWGGVAPAQFVAEGQGLLSKSYAASRWARYRGATQREVPWGEPPGWNGTLGAGALEDDRCVRLLPACLLSACLLSACLLSACLLCAAPHRATCCCWQGSYM
jgi:hypothetical protein